MSKKHLIAATASEMPPLPALTPVSGECNSACPYCGVGCGVTVRQQDADVTVSGDDSHPANLGRLCVKGSMLSETVVSEGRLLQPQVNGASCDWNTAMDSVATALRTTLEQYGPQSVAFYLSGQLLTEDYYVANKLMKGFLGSGNVDTNSRLCMASAVAAQKRAFGADYVPCSYSDLEDCDLLVIVGSNAAWTHPVLYRRMVTSRRENPDKRVVVIDPRRTATTNIADTHLAIRPGSDGVLFAGLLNYLKQDDRIDLDWVREHVAHWEESLDAVQAWTVDAVAVETGLSENELIGFYEQFAATRRVVTFYSQGINQSATGTDKANLIINCHLATGRIGFAGAGPFSITGQPNAMGGREVGGLANQLAAHMDFTPDAIDRVGRFWDAPSMAQGPGLKAVDLFAAMGRGDIKFVWIMATNPAVSLPDSAGVREALARCETVVVSDCIADTDTAKYADILLPAAGWGEKDGTVTNSERVISRQRAFREPAGDSRPDWYMVCDLAARLGFGDAFSYTSPAAIFREHAALSAFENQGSRDFDIGAMATLSDDEFAAMEPVRWPAPASGVSPPSLPAFHRDGRMHMIPVTAVPAEAPRLKTGDAVTQLLLNTGRLRDQWHTMTRTGLAPTLNRHQRFFAASLHPETAAAMTLCAGDLLQISNEGGLVRAVVSIDDGVAPGSVFLPIHWSDRFASAARVSCLLPAITDAVSGQPQSKLARVAVEKVSVEKWMLVFTREALPRRSWSSDYWSRVRVAGGEAILMAASDHSELLAAVDDLTPEAERLAITGQSPGMERRFWFDHGLAGALYAHEDHRSLPDPAWLERQLRESLPSPRWKLLAEPAARDVGDALICACHDVSQSAIVAAIGEGLCTTGELGARLKCGTGCGSCVPELQALIEEHAAPAESQQALA